MDEEVDLVGITVITDLALRAYHIAKLYRQRGVRVVMGGIHPTVMPQEALQHADAVVVGEAEEAWPRLVSDAASGRLQRLYRSSGLTDMAGLPVPQAGSLSRISFQGIRPYSRQRRGIPGLPLRL